MKEEATATKAYKVPVEAPGDLMEAYFEAKRKALEEVLSYVTHSRTGKAHLKLKAGDRRKLRNNLLKDWKYSRHYVDSAINSVIGLVKGWIKLYNRGKARSKPRVTGKTVYVKSTLFTYRDGKLKISIEPGKRHLEVNLARYDNLPKNFDTIGGLLLREDGLIITFKKKVVGVEPRDWASFDINLTNVTALISGRVVRYDLRQLYHVHRAYEEKRRRIQKLSKRKPKVAERLMRKYSRREKDRARDFMHKLTARIAGELGGVESGAILEDLRNIKSKVLRRSRNLNRRLSKWNARTFQFMLEYKLRWLGLPVKYVNPSYSSRTCPLCSGRMAAYEGRLMRCKKCCLILDRDVVAVLNLRMWGSGVTPKVPSEAYASMTGKRLTDQNHLPIKTYQA